MSHENIAVLIDKICRRKDVEICRCPSAFGYLLARVGDEIIKFEGVNNDSIVKQPDAAFGQLNVFFRSVRFAISPQDTGFDDLVECLASAQNEQKAFYELVHTGHRLAQGHFAFLAAGENATPADITQIFSEEKYQENFADLAKNLVAACHRRDAAIYQMPHDDESPWYRGTILLRFGEEFAMMFGQNEKGRIENFTKDVTLLSMEFRSVDFGITPQHPEFSELLQELARAAKNVSTFTQAHRAAEDIAIKNLRKLSDI